MDTLLPLFIAAVAAGILTAYVHYRLLISNIDSQEGPISPDEMDGSNESSMTCEVNTESSEEGAVQALIKLTDSQPPNRWKGESPLRFCTNCEAINLSYFTYCRDCACDISAEPIIASEEATDIFNH